MSYESRPIVRRRGARWRVPALLLTLTLVLAACTGGDDEEPAPDTDDITRAGSSGMYWPPSWAVGEVQ